MGLSFREYIVQESGALKRVPRRVAEGLVFGLDAIPEYAGTRQRVVEVLIENQDRRPVRILDSRGMFWDFDDEGRIAEGLHAAVADLMDSLPDLMTPAAKSEGKVVDLVPGIKKKQFQERHRWPVTKDLLELVAADLWPGVHGPAPDVATVKGKAPKRPALSYKASDALREIDGKIEGIVFELATLNEHALKGLAFEAARLATFENGELWTAVGEAAKRQLAIRAAYRTGKGEWIAVIETFVSDERDPIVTSEGPKAHVRCGSQAEAIEAAKRLVAEKAEWVGPNTRVEVGICSALEWRDDEPPGNRS